MRGAIWLGDAFTAVRELCPDGAAAAAIARSLGLLDDGDAAPGERIVDVEPRPPGEPAAPEAPGAAQTTAPPPAAAPSDEPEEADGEGYRLPCVVKAASTSPDTVNAPPWLTSQAALAPLSATRSHPRPSLLSLRQRRVFLTTMLSTTVQDGDPDLRRIIARLALGRALDRLPRKRRKTLREGVEVRRDSAPWLVPFQDDQTDLIDILRRLVPADRLRITTVDGGPEPAADAEPPSGQAGRLAPVLLLSDLGAGWQPSAQPPAPLSEWRAFARERMGAGRRVFALVPIAAASQPEVAPIVVLPWDERSGVTDLRRSPTGARVHTGRGTQERWPGMIDAQSAAERLALRVCAAQQVSPWLLRTARRSLAMPPAAEAALWFSPLVEASGIDGVTLTPSALDRLRRLLAGADPMPQIDRQPIDVLSEREVALSLVRADRDVPDRADGRGIEESLIELELRGQLNEATAEARLRPALKALSLTVADDDARMTALWAAHAWGRASTAVRETSAARQLAFAAASRLRTKGWLTHEGERPALPPGGGWLFGAVQPALRSLQLRRFEDGSTNLIVGPFERRTQALHVIEIPATEPLWLEARAVGLDGEDTWQETLAVAGEDPVQCDARAITMGAAIALRAIDGRSWLVQYPEAGQELRGSLLDATIEGLAGHHRAIVVDERLAVLTFVESLTEGDRQSPSSHLEQGRELAFRVPGAPSVIEARVLTHVRHAALTLAICERLGRADEWRPFDAAVRIPLAGSATTETSIPLATFESSSQRHTHVPVLFSNVEGPDWSIGVEGRPEAEERLPWSEVYRSAREAARAVGEERLPRFLLLAPPEAGDIAHRLWDHLVSRIGGTRVVWDHDGRVFGDALARAENTTALADLDAVILLADDDPTWLPAAVRRAIDEERLAVLAVPLSARGAQARAGWSRSLHKAAVRQSFFGQPVDPVGWLANHDQAAFDLVVELAESWRPFARSRQAESLSPEVAGPAVAEPARSIGTSLRVTLANLLEQRSGQQAGLLRVRFNQGGYALEKADWPSDTQPALLMIHSMAADAAGTFDGFLNSPERHRLMQAYGDRIFAWQWRSVTVGPLRNATLLATALGSGAPAHLLTSSAGGLLPELLAYAESALRHGSPATSGAGGPPEHATWPGIEPGFDTELKRLLDTVARTPPNIERFVRVACPAAGTEIFGERLDRAFAPIKLLGVLAPPLYFIPGMRSLIGDANASPGFATLAPGKGVLPLLTIKSGQATRMPLTIIAGVAEPKSMMSRLFSSGVAAVLLGGGQHGHDQVVTLASAFGGVEREGGVSYLIDRGPSVTHFNYFRNDRTRLAIVDALLHGDRPGGFESATSLAELQRRFATAGDSARPASVPAV